MKILVLLSTYNGEKFLCEQLDSILSQRDVEVNILIRDDGSSDSTPEILKNYEKSNCNVNICLGGNVGCAESFRILLNIAYNMGNSYNFYAFADQDDVWLPEKLYTACKKLKTLDRDLPCLYCSNLRVVDEDLNYIGMKYKKEQKLISKGESLVCSMATGCTMVFNHRVLEIFDAYPPKRMIIHDLWILHTCIFLGDVLYDDNAYILYRQHERNVIGAKMTFWSQIKVKSKSLMHLFSEHENELEAKELLRCFSPLLSIEDKALIRILADYRKSWRNWWRLLLGKNRFAMRIRRQRNNWILKIRIIIRCV